MENTLKEPHLILGIGELLWDVLPEGERLGGAPANFTVMASRLGNHAAILSRIGRDERGRRAVERLDPLPVDTAHIQVDPVHPTGHVTVEFEGGQPQYTIHDGSAWDYLELTDEWVAMAERADALCFGSLGQRSPEARKTIQSLAAQTPSSCVRVFDVNLRTPYFSSEILEESLGLATVVKMNDAEVPLVLGLLGLPEAAETGTAALRLGAERILAEFPDVNLVAVTRGGHGSLLVSREEWHEHPGIPVKVADTIGAGDAFTAAMTHYLLRGATLATLNEAGNRWGGWVAAHSGAMPAVTEATLVAMAAAIEG